MPFRDLPSAARLGPHPEPRGVREPLAKVRRRVAVVGRNSDGGRVATALEAVR